MKETGAGGRSRGFGFVRLKSAAAHAAALREGHMHIDGRRVRRERGIARATSLLTYSLAYHGRRCRRSQVHPRSNTPSPSLHAG